MSISPRLQEETAPEQNIAATAMVREANHRIANQLSMMVSMVRMQAMQIGRGPEQIGRGEVQALLKEVTGKLVSIGHLHRLLADRPETGDIELADYLVGHADALVHSLALNDILEIAPRLERGCKVPPVMAQPIALIVTEFIINAVKHAHPSGVPTHITLSCARRADGRISLAIADDGVGLPDGFEAASDGGVGFGLIHRLAESVRAEMTLASDSLGLTLQLVLPASAASVAAR